MHINVYTIYDHKAFTYSNPFYSVTDGAACRTLLEVCREGNNNLSKYPEDFRLFKTGVFDTDSGLILALSVPAFVTDVVTLMRGGPSPADNS
ncbi:nonstructural protein [robinz microvirus RP_104]|nr:nonstructural protein [robinz microvirus RP_104]